MIYINFVVFKITNTFAVISPNFIRFNILKNCTQYVKKLPRL